MEILYCERCGIRVPEKDIEAGQALRGPDGVVCAQCNKVKVVRPAGAARGSGVIQLPGTAKTERRSEVAIKSAARSTSSSVHAPARASAPARSGVSNSALVTIGILGMAVVVVGLLLALRSNEKPVGAQPPEHAAPAVPTPAVPVPAPVPVVNNPPRPQPDQPEPAPSEPDPVPAPADSGKADLELQAEYETLMRFEGIAANNLEGKCAKIQAFIDAHPSTLLAARARVALEDLRKGAAVAVDPPAKSTATVGAPGGYRVIFGTPGYSSEEPAGLRKGHMIWSEAPAQQWVVRYCRFSFDGGGKRAVRARMIYTVDDESKVYLNGRFVAATTDWRNYQFLGFLKALKPRNVFAFECKNLAGAACLNARIHLEFEDKTEKIYESGPDWKWSDKLEEGWNTLDFNDSAWKPAVTVGEAEYKDALFPKDVTQWIDHDVSASPALPAPQAGEQGAAVFVAIDADTKGAWPGVYGKDGYVLIGQKGVPNGHSETADTDLAKLPDYVANITKEGGFTYKWGPNDAAPRAADGSPLDLIANYSDTTFSYVIHLKDERSCRLALYACDPEKGVRSMQVDVVSAADGKVLDSRKLENYQDGKYLVWLVRGKDIKISFKNLAQLSSICNAVFFDSGKDAAAEPVQAAERKADPPSAKQPDPAAAAAAAKLDAAIGEVESLVNMRRWRDAYDKIQTLNVAGAPALSKEQKERLAPLELRANIETASYLINAERVKLTGAKRMLPDGRWEFFYDFKNPAQRLDFRSAPDLLSQLEKGELLLCGGSMAHLFDFSGDLEISYEVMPLGPHFGRVVLGCYDVRGEMGYAENGWSGLWHASSGAADPLCKNENFKAVLGRWQRIDIVFEGKTKTITVSQDGKEMLKCADPASVGRGSPFLSTYLQAKFRNLRIKGFPTVRGIERAEELRKVTGENARRFSTGQPMNLFEKKEEFAFMPHWQQGQDEIAGTYILYAPGIASTNYELTFEARRVDAKAFQIYFRRDAVHSWHVSMDDTAVVARMWDHANATDFKLPKSVAANTVAFHKFQVRSYARTLKVIMDDKETLLDVKDVPLDALGFFFSAVEGRGALRKINLRYLP